MEEKTDLELRFVQYTRVAATKEKVLSLITNLQLKPIDGLKVFEQIEQWINTRK